MSQDNYTKDLNITPTTTMSMLIKCNCGYEWKYKGKNKFATCPNCYRKVNTHTHKVE